MQSYFIIINLKTNSEPTPTSASINGNENFPAAVPAQPQRNNYRSARPPAMGNGRTGSGPGSYNNRERDQDRGKNDFPKFVTFLLTRIPECR